MARTKPTQRRAAPRCGCEAWEDPLAPPSRVLCASQVAHQQRVTGESLSPEDQRALPSALREVHELVRQLQGGQSLHEDSALAVVLRAATHHMRVMDDTAAAAVAAPAPEAAAAASSSSSAAAAAPAEIPPPLLPMSTAAERHAARLPQLEADAATGCGHALSRLDRYRAEPPPLSADQLHQQALVNGLDEMADERIRIDFEWQLYPDPLLIGACLTPRLLLAQTAFTALLGSPLPSSTPIGHVFQAARHMAARAERRRAESRAEENKHDAEEDEEQETEEARVPISLRPVYRFLRSVDAELQARRAGTWVEEEEEGREEDLADEEEANAAGAEEEEEEDEENGAPAKKRQKLEDASQAPASSP